LYSIPRVATLERLKRRLSAQVYSFTVGNVKQFGFQYTLKMPRNYMLETL